MQSFFFFSKRRSYDLIVPFTNSGTFPNADGNFTGFVNSVAIAPNGSIAFNARRAADSLWQVSRRDGPAQPIVSIARGGDMGIVNAGQLAIYEQIPEDLREKIFDPFYTTKHGSSGIGLSISQRIVEDHGGTLTVEPGQWGGAAFTITLPVAEGTT